MDDIKHQLIELLNNDKEIKTILSQLVQNSPKKTKLEKNSDLKKELKQMKKMWQDIKERLGFSEQENKVLTQTVEELTISHSHLEITHLEDNKNHQILTSQLKRVEKEVEYYHQLFKQDIAAYQLFEGLSTQTHQSIDGIFSDRSITGFIACGIQERNITSLWDYIKNEIMENNHSDIPALKEIFSFLFSRYALAYPIYTLQPVELDEAFDAQKHIKHSHSSNVSGNIQDVVFKGWINTKTNKVMKQSLVII